MRSPFALALAGRCTKRKAVSPTGVRPDKAAKNLGLIVSHIDAQPRRITRGVADDICVQIINIDPPARHYFIWIAVFLPRSIVILSLLRVVGQALSHQYGTIPLEKKNLTSSGIQVRGAGTRIQGGPARSALSPAFCFWAGELLSLGADSCNRLKTRKA